VDQAVGYAQAYQVAVVALANRTARLEWAITRHGSGYDPALAAQVA